MLALLVSIPLLVIIGLIVFGGGQVFIPLFQSLWRFLATTFNVNISEDIIDGVIAIANGTPGVISTKFGLFTGYLVANGAWWGYLVMILTYIVFALPSIIIMIFASKFVQKASTSKHLKNIIVYMRPVIVGILLSLVVQLVISTMFPYILFNRGIKEYLGTLSSSKVQFFAGTKQIILYIWIPIATLLNIYLLKRKLPFINKKIPLYFVILINFTIAILIFWPF